MANFGDASPVPSATTMDYYADPRYTSLYDNGEDAKLDCSVASIRDVIEEEKETFPILHKVQNTRKNQKEQMKEQNIKLARYVHENQNLDDKIRELIRELRESEGKNSDKTLELAKEMREIKTRSEGYLQQHNEIFQIRKKIGALDNINMNLHGDIGHLEHKIEYTSARIEALKQSIERANNAIKLDQAEIDHLEPKKKVLVVKREKATEEHQEKIQRLMKMHLQAGHLDPSDFRPQPSDRDIEKQLEKIREFRKQKFSPDLQAIIEENEKTAKAIEVAEAYSIKLDKDIKQLEAVQAKEVDKNRELESEIKFLRSRRDTLLDQIAASRTYYDEEISRFDLRIMNLQNLNNRLTEQEKETMEKYRYVLNKELGYREKIDAELRKMNMLIHSGNRRGSALYSQASDR